MALFALLFSQAKFRLGGTVISASEEHGEDFLLLLETDVGHR